MKPIVIGNWKANPATLAEAQALFSSMKSLFNLKEVEVVVCPPAVWFASLAPEGGALGAQNVYFEERGPFTGEISIGMLKDLKIMYALVGHSERRRLFHEDDELIAKKLAALQLAGLIPIVCVGSEAQALGEAEKNRIKVQLEAVLAKADLEKPLVIAYEPVWAISTSGTGKVATPEYAVEIINFIRALLPKEIRSSTRLIYGGSVDKNNAAGFLSQPGIDGVLPGAASLKPDHFAAIVAAAQAKVL